MESCWKGDDDDFYSYSEIQDLDCVDASSPAYDSGSTTGDFLNWLPSICEEFPQDDEGVAFGGGSAQEMDGTMIYSSVPLDGKDPFLDQVDFSLDMLSQPNFTNFVSDGVEVDFPESSEESAPSTVKMITPYERSEAHGDFTFPLHSQNLCKKNKMESCEMHESQSELRVADSAQLNKDAQTEENRQLNKAPAQVPAQQAITRQIRSSTRAEDLICDQTQSMIARLRIFFRAYGRAMASSALLNPDELTSQATGFPLNIVLTCNDPVPKKPCITLAKKKRKEQEGAAKDHAPVRARKKNNSLDKNEKSLAVVTTKPARRRGKKDAMCDNTTTKGAARKKKASDMACSSHSTDLPDDPNPSETPKAPNDRHFEDASLKKSCEAGGADENSSPLGIKNIKGYTMGVRWSARIEHKAKVFYGNVQRRRSSDQSTPESSSAGVNAAQPSRSSGRKRRPRRVFSPLLTKEKKKYFMLMDLLREKFKITVEASDEVLEDAFLSFD